MTINPPPINLPHGKSDDASAGQSNSLRAAAPRATRAGARQLRVHAADVCVSRVRVGGRELEESVSAFLRRPRGDRRGVARGVVAKLYEDPLEWVVAGRDPRRGFDLPMGRYAVAATEVHVPLSRRNVFAVQAVAGCV